MPRISIRPLMTPGFLLALAFIMLAPGTGSLPLQDRDEPRFAQAAREMMERRDAVVPTFNGDYRFDKPPLIYWMMIGAYAAGGVAEWTARAPSILCAFLLAWLTWRTGARWFTPRAGLLAGVMTLTHFQIIQHGRAAVADMPMILAVLVAQIVLFERLMETPDRPAPRGWFWWLYAAFGLGFLAKGPVAVLIPLLTIPVYWLIAGRPALRLARLKPFAGLLMVLIIIGAWGIPALIATNGEFARIGLGKHVVARGMESFEGHGAPFFFYLLSAPISLFPWSRFLPVGIAGVWRERDPATRFLAAWIVVTFVLFSLYATKLPHYVMPCYPAIFLLLGRALDAGFTVGRAGRIWDIAIRAVVGLAAALLAGAAVAAYQYGPWPMGAAALLGGALLLGGMMAVPRAVLRPRAGAIALAALLLITGTELLARGLRAVNPTLRAMPALAGLPPEAPCAFSGYREPSVVFYTNRRWTTADDASALRAFAQASGPRALLVRLHEQRLDFKKPRERNGELNAWFDSLTQHGYTLTRTDGWNAARSSRVELGIAVRGATGNPYVE